MHVYMFFRKKKKMHEVRLAHSSNTHGIITVFYSTQTVPLSIFFFEKNNADTLLAEGENAVIYKCFS